MTWVTVLTALMIVIGLVGIVAPVLPGLFLVWGGVAVWAFAARDSTGWITLGVATAFTVGGSVAKYALPGRQLRAAGVPTRTLVAGGVLGVIGFFVVPLLGLFLGFCLGVYLAERARLGTHAQAWPSTLQALRAVGWSIAIELATGLLVAGTWLIAVLTAA